jgi:hypothetical protein
MDTVGIMTIMQRQASTRECMYQIDRDKFIVTVVLTHVILLLSITGTNIIYLLLHYILYGCSSCSVCLM